MDVLERIRLRDAEQKAEAMADFRRAVYVMMYPSMGSVYDSTFARGGQGDTGESQAMYDRALAVSGGLGHVLRALRRE